MEITLLRHGKPGLRLNDKYKAVEYKGFMEKYDEAGLDKDFKPPLHARERADDCGVVLSSDLPRTIESAKALNTSDRLTIEPIFREAMLPAGSFGPIKLSANTWGWVFRAVWFLGYSNGSESFKEARMRAAKCADRLASLAEAHTSVMLVGHGIVNYLIAKVLLSNGWSGPIIPSLKYWQYGVYSYNRNL
jgi:broad specificity phosphatase PhoE